MSEEQWLIEQASAAFSNQDFERALELIQPLIETRHAVAIGLLGLAYQHGAGVKQDSNEAIKLMQQAVELGDALSAHNLGRLYMLGTEDVEPVPELSQKYYNLAKAMGIGYESDPQASKNI